MVSPGQIPVQHPLRPWSVRGMRAASLVLTCVFLLACSTSYQSNARLVADLPPLQLDNDIVSVGEVHARVPTPDLLAVDERMKEFVQTYTQDVHEDRARLMMLHRAIKGSATMGVQYDSQADGTARDAFYRGSANCLTYASLFVALAREAGLDANYQWLEVSPQWTRDKERVMVRLHVNALVRVNKREQYMVDIDPLESRDIAGSRQMSDADALALYHSNIAMDALGAGNTERAWLQGVRALQLSPDNPHLWVNLGAIYRFNGQHRDAEHSYLHALQLDPEERSAMNNLVVLYGIEGRSVQRAFWELRVARYRNANPYYHAWLGEEAAEAEDWQEAVHSYERALALSSEDSRLLFALGRSYQQLGKNAIAAMYLSRAIEAAPTRVDKAAYQMHLNTLQTQPRSMVQGSMRM
jgi:Flp pilus assembly protein TadD